MVAAGSITVAVRVRPPTQTEGTRLPASSVFDSSLRGDGALSVRSTGPTGGGLREILQIVDDRILMFDPDEKDRARAFVERGFLPPGTKRYKDKRFMFDRVFGYDASQHDVYGATARPLLDGLLDGYNATIFAYGATGCGKTHTISGTEADPGIVYLTMADLFERIEEKRTDCIVEVLVTFLEIYNEEIRDLLSDSANTSRGGLSIREDKTVKVVGLTELKPQSADEVKQIVIQGNTRRTQSPTHANETSSRSHAVLQVHVSSSPRTAALTEERTMATLNIIDLAGSERAAATTNMGQRMIEGANINKSLLALGNCINALCESGGAIRHVPYRNSKLTRLLKFSLGGNCKTVMIVCVAPTSAHFDDTHNTLLYAERATKIKTKVVTRNVVNVDRHVGQYVEAINRLNSEVAELKQRLAGKLANENELHGKKKRDAAADVERARSDIEAKAEHTKPSILDGAACAGYLGASTAKLHAIRSRLAVLDIQATSNPLPADLDAERNFLQALVAPEERTSLDLQARLTRSGNAGAMFDATLRAVSERKSDRLDEVNVENIRLHAKAQRAEMEMAKAQAECGAVKEAYEKQAEVMVTLFGLAGRCKVMMSEAATALKRSSCEEDGKERVDEIAGVLERVVKSSDTAFSTLVGYDTTRFRDGSGTSALDNFTGYALPTLRPSASSVAQKPKNARRTSGAGVSVSPGRKAHAYRVPPRRSLRSSLAPQPYRRAASESKDKKSVQWRDEVGRGSIDDGGIRSAAQTSYPPAASLPAIAVTPAETGFTPSGRSTSMSFAGSESDWEDEKNEDSISSASTSVLSASTSALPSGTNRPRSSRFDTAILKSKGRGPATALGSLTECDETSSGLREPLGDRSMNASQLMPELHIPKKRDAGSPARRAPSTPHVAGKARRRSNIGPVRSEKTRRRSSMIPQPSPSSADEDSSSSAGPRRVALSVEKSPAKRPRRMSILSRGGLNSLKGTQTLANTSLSETNGDFSFRMNASSRQAWR